VAASPVSHTESGDVSVLMESYDRDLLAVLDRHAPLCTKKVPVVFRDKVPWYNADVHKARLSWRKAERQWRKTKLEVHRQLYRAKHVVVVRTIERAKRDFYHNKIQAIGSNQR
jgi:hypothetical protein